MEMAYCAEHAIPYSRYLEEWDFEDRARLIALKMEEGSRCQMCGTADWEWEENKFAYEPILKYCHGCYLKDIQAEESQNQPGRQVVLVPPETITYSQRLRMFGLDQTDEEGD